MSTQGGFTDARKLPDGATLQADACVIGSGAGGAVVAALLARAGIQTLVLEEGGHHTRLEFHMREDESFPMLYQEAGGRMTKDLGMTILQGRAVGGTTVVNYTTCFRTPDAVLAHWKKEHAVSGLTPDILRPHFEAIEARLNVVEWPIDQSNLNNRLLYDGCKAIGLDAYTTRRNVKNCFKSGYCGMGCPVDAKQSMLVTFLPDAVERGATVVSRCRVDRLETERGRVAAAACTVLGDDGYRPTGARLRVEAKRFVLAAGGIGTPAILIRSGLGGGMVGRRTFLHPVAGVFARWKQRIEPFYGPPQSVASHALAERGDRVGIFLEAAPLHPMIMAIATNGFGEDHRRVMAELPYYTGHIALAIDGFHRDEPGGTVIVRQSGAPVLDYETPPRVWEGLREGIKVIARANLAMGALRLTCGPDPALWIESERELPKIDQMDIARAALFSAHVMGGCKLGDNPATSVVRSEDLRHHQLANLYVIDGSVFPTSLGVNPQESIYGLAHLMGGRLAQGWS